MGQNVGLGCFLESGKRSMGRCRMWQSLGSRHRGEVKMLPRLRILSASVCPEFCFVIDIKVGGPIWLKIEELWWVGESRR